MGKTTTPNFKSATLFVFVLISTFLSSSFAQTVLNFSSSGTWTVPCGVTSINVQIWGGGGGGGGDATAGWPAGSGGGSGARVQYFGLAVTPGQVYTFTVGAGGVGIFGNNAPVAANSGGTTTFNGPALGAPLVAGGGSPGGCNGAAGGAGSPLATGGTGNTVGLAGQTCPIAGPSSGSGTGAPGGGGNAAGCGTDGCTGNTGSVRGGGGAGGGPRGSGTTSTGGNGGAGAVRIAFTSTLILPDAGLDQSACGILNISGNAPSPGWTATWSVVSGSAVIDVPGSLNTAVSAIPSGTCATIRLTFSAPGCVDMTDDVVLCNPVNCNDGPCNATPIPVGNNVCNYISLTSVGATVSNGMAQPGCGSFSQFGSEDVWYYVVVPANGSLTIQGIDAAGGTNMYPGIALYTGTCTNLIHQGCEFTTSLATPAMINYVGTPGEIVYVRLWDYFDNTGVMDICASTHTNAVGTVIAGTTNTLTCGSSMSFMDPGGTGNYLNEQDGFYTICPSTPGTYVSVNFSSFNLQSGFDYLTVINGDGTFDPIIGNYTGTTIPATITSSAPDGCLSFAFRSNSSIVSTGWNATVTCSATPGTNTQICTSTNCSGDCGDWVCGDGLYPTENQGTSSVQEFYNQAGGCMQGAGEISTKWFYFTTLTAGTVSIEFDGPTGQDYDFAIWGPTTNGEPICPSNTGLPPIRCSYAAAPNPVGLGNGATEFYEETTGDGWVAPLTVNAGETYAMVMNIVQNGNPQPVIDITFAGSSQLDCTPVTLGISLSEFSGMNQGAKNLLTWITKREFNNDFFTVERSVDGENWEVVGTKDGAGNSDVELLYNLVDYQPYFPLTYYRLMQTDIDGGISYSKVVTVNVDEEENPFVGNLHPNPAMSYAMFTYNGNDSETPLNVRIINEMGAEVSNLTYKDIYKDQPYMLGTDGLAKGVYQVIFTQGETTETQKLSIVK